MQWYIIHLKCMQKLVKKNKSPVFIIKSPVKTGLFSSTIAKLKKNNYNIGGKAFLPPKILQKRIKSK